MLLPVGRLCGGPNGGLAGRLWPGGLWRGTPAPSGTVVMQYTGLDEYTPEDPPTFVCVGDSDWIAPWQIMKARADAMSACGIDTEFHCYPSLGHGFGLGTGTAAEGWLDLAVRFWERQKKKRA